MDFNTIEFEKFKIKSVNPLYGQFLCDYNGREVIVDVTVGCVIPSSFFDLFDFNELVGEELLFSGNWYSGDENLLLATNMTDVGYGRI